MDIRDFLRMQTEAVVRAIGDHAATGFAAALDLSLLEQRVRRGNGSVRPLGRFTTAVCVTNKFGDKELWCKARAGSYEAAFTRFANEEFGFRYTKSEYPDYDVDHLFNRGRVRPSGAPVPGDDEFYSDLPESTMVRMVLVKSDVNRSFGSMFEKRLSGKNDGRREYRDFTSMQLAKALNIHPNTSGDGLASDGNLVHIVREMDRLGVLAALKASHGLMLSELMSQRDFAARKVQ